MRRSICIAVAALAAAFTVASAHATLFNGSYTVIANANISTGLAVGTINDFGAPVTATTNSFTGLNVSLGGIHFFDLFELFSLEDPITSGDTTPEPISVTFNFTSPSVLSGIISGT